MGLLASFWALIIFVMSSGNRVMRARSIGKQVRDHFALMLAHAEAKLDQALWRQAYRRLVWQSNLVRLHIIAPTIRWPDTQERLAHYVHAFRNMNRVVDAYVDDIRARYSIAKNDVTDGLCPSHATASRTTLASPMGENSTVLFPPSPSGGGWIAASSGETDRAATAHAGRLFAIRNSLFADAHLSALAPEIASPCPPPIPSPRFPVRYPTP